MKPAETIPTHPASRVADFAPAGLIGRGFLGMVAEMRGWISFSVALLAPVGLLLAGPPVNYTSAQRGVDAAADAHGEVSEEAPSMFGDYVTAISVDGEEFGSVARATQTSYIKPWEIDVEVLAEADMDYIFFSGSGYSTSSFELVFEVAEAVPYELNGRVSGYDGVGQFSLTSVWSATGQTEFPDPEFPDFGTPGGSVFDLSGVLQPGSYTLRAMGQAAPNLGGYGGGDAGFVLRFLPRTFAEWLEVNGFASGTDPDADDDGDGVPLFQEYVFDADPRLADASEAQPGVDFNAGTRVMTMIYPGERADLRYVVEWSTDLVNWSSEGTTRFDEGLEVLARYTVPVGEDRIAMRLRAEPSGAGGG